MSLFNFDADTQDALAKALMLRGVGNRSRNGMGGLGSAINTYVGATLAGRASKTREADNAADREALMAAVRAFGQGDQEGAYAAAGKIKNPDYYGLIAKQLMPRDPEAGFELDPGETRFDAQGNVIASLPALAKEGAGFELSPGQTRFDAQGNPIASLPGLSDEGPAAPSGYRWTEGGELEPIPGGPASGAQGGTMTAAQVRTNQQIAEARRMLKALPREEVMRRSQTADPATGLPNPDYDPYLAAQVRLALSPMYGDDAEYSGLYGEWFGGGQSLPLPGPISEGADAGPDGPGMLDRGLDFLSGMFEGNDPASGTPSPTNRPLPSRASGVAQTQEPLAPGTIIGGRARVSEVSALPVMQGGQIDAAKLKAGQVYSLNDGTRWRWNGQGFEEVQ